VGIKLRTLTVLRYRVIKSITIVQVSSSYIQINITQLSRCDSRILYYRGHWAWIQDSEFQDFAKIKT